jgi:uncharacterized protein (TIGR03437 family)
LTKSIFFALTLYTVLTLPVLAQTTATIAIDTKTTNPIRPGLSGFNDDQSIPIEYWDYNFNALTNQLHPGWIRFPGGESSEAFNWRTGQDMLAWVDEYDASTNIGSGLRNQINWLSGKGGAKFIDAANQANLWGAQIVVCVNTFTDTAQSAGLMAAYANANGIHVAVWELGNEAYNQTPNFYANGADYITKVKPYYDAIKAADPNAIVSIFFDDPGRTTTPNPAWNKSIEGVTDKYWDAVSYHFYPADSTGAFSNWMADENAILATQTDAYITGYMTSVNPPGMLYVISEFNTSFGNGGTQQGLTTGTLYGAVYCAEFIMRMSKVPSLLVVGPHAIYNDSGVQANDYHYNDVNTAAAAGESIDTSTFNFGYFFSAQGLGPAIINGVLKNATLSDKTTVNGGATVPATGVGNISALYAQAYSTASGALSVMVTNKGATAQQVTIQVNGTTPAGPFPLQYISGTDPTVTNSLGVQAVVIKTASSSNPVTIPPYSVVRADLVTPAVATLVHAASYQSGPLAPNQLVSAFGSGFASQAIGATSQPLPTVLGATTIAITDSTGAVAMAPLDYVSPGQANFLIPAGLATGAATVKVMQNGTTVLTGSFTVASAAPGIFTANGNGAGVIAGAVSRVSAAGVTTPEALFSCGTVAYSCLETPIPLGASTDTVYITLYGTGIRGAKSVQAYVAGVSVPVAYAGPQGSFAGLDQINITLPQGLAGTGEASVYLIADGQQSNVASLKIQ